VRAGACKVGTFKNESDDKHCNWGHTGRELHPMNCVNWCGAAAFCLWAGARQPNGHERYNKVTNGGTRKYL